MADKPGHDHNFRVIPARREAANPESRMRSVPASGFRVRPAAVPE
jgi:hypothetical protein